MHHQRRIKHVLIYTRAATAALARKPTWATVKFALRYARPCVALYENELHGRWRVPRPWM